MATSFAPTVYKNYINGEWFESRSGGVIEDHNPANTDELIGIFPASSAEDVAAAVDAAKAAFAKWRLTPAPKRAEILFRAAEILVRAKGRLRGTDDARDGQGASGNARRRAGSHRHDLFDGRRRAPHVRPDHAFRTAEQVCDVGTRAGGRRRADHAVEFSRWPFLRGRRCRRWSAGTRWC